GPAAGQGPGPGSGERSPRSRNSRSKPCRICRLPAMSAVRPSLHNLDPIGPGHRVTLGETLPLKLDCGLDLGPFRVAYCTYGTLNADKSNAILVCHALTGDQHAANPHPITGKPGWWGTMVGPGKVIDTDRFFVICANVLGGCM